jgi:hypothetical protein
MKLSKLITLIKRYWLFNLIDIINDMEFIKIQNVVLLQDWNKTLNVYSPWEITNKFCSKVTKTLDTRNYDIKECEYCRSCLTIDNLLNLQSWSKWI